VVHDVVCAHGAGVLGLDELHLHLTKVHKGLQEFIRLGLIPDHQTRLSGAQAEGCSPVVTAWREGSEIIKPVKPHTLAKSLAIGNPADGIYAARVDVAPPPGSPKLSELTLLPIDYDYIEKESTTIKTRFNETFQ